MPREEVFGSLWGIKLVAMIKNNKKKLGKNSKSMLLCLALMMGSAVPSHALDVKEMLKGEDAKSPKIMKFYFAAREQGNKEEAMDVLLYLADQGNDAAQWKLGRIYQTGDGVKEDPLTAFNFFKKVADRYSEAKPNTPNWQYSANALVALGNYFRDGIPNTDIKSDINQARTMYTTAAMVFRHPQAQYELGKLQMEQGRKRQAVRMFSMAAKKGHIGAEAMLGYMLFQGEAVRREPVRGLYMLTKARDAASTADKNWISQKQEEAFALATEQQRREAMELMADASPSK